MKTLYLILSLLLISCGKPKNDGDLRAELIRPRTILTRTPHQPSVRIKIFCYNALADGGLTASYILKGNFYRGNFTMCNGKFESCISHGKYVHFFIENYSCLAKEGFEEQFKLCLSSENPDERSSNVGTLVRMDLTIDTDSNDLWCEKKILKIMFDGNSGT